MWNYNRQIIIRWVSFILAAMALMLFSAVFSRTNPDFLTSLGLKAVLTQITISMEFWPVYIWPAAFLIILSGLLLGMPTVILFSALFPFLGFLYSFMIVFLCQSFATAIALIMAIRKNDRQPVEKKLRPSLRNKLQELKLDHTVFAFWSRVYFSFPLRTIDAVSPVLTPDDQPLSSTVLPASAAIIIRMAIPCLWAASLISLLKNVSPDPAGDITSFLLWSSALVAYTLIPRIPELFMCPEKVKDCLKEIEEMKPAGPKSFDEELIIGNNKTQKPQVAKKQKADKTPTGVPQPETGI